MNLDLFSRINKNITMIHLSDMDSNIYLVNNETLIDTGTGFNFVRLMDIFRRLGKSFDDIKRIVNTHAHFDHIGGNGFFSNAKIFIHERDANVLENGDMEMSNAKFFNGKLRPLKVEKRLRENDVIEGLKVLHTPGHTPGSICLYDSKEKVLFSGDTIFSDGVGRTDLPGGNEKDLEKSIEKLTSIQIEKILCGHGGPVLKDGNKIIKNIVTSVSEQY
jgi:glyoxylase-like metal-dependent hydrolase (beta-lactamase superfamily II)